MRWTSTVMTGMGLLAVTGCSQSTTAPAAKPTITSVSPAVNSPVDPHVNGTVQNNSTPDPVAPKPSGNQAAGGEQSAPPVIHKHLVPELSAVPYGDVAITIDDGPTVNTQQIVDILDKFHAKATFFFIGERIQMYPGAVAAVVKQGDVIGDHTENHGVLPKMTEDQQSWQIVDAAHQIQMYDPVPITLFRPPYEAFDDNTETVLAKNHMALALWNRDPLDWAAKTPEDIVNNVLKGNPSGCVFDMHDTRMTALALPAIIEGLQKQHLHLVVLSAPTGVRGIPVSRS